MSRAAGNTPGGEPGYAAGAGQGQAAGPGPGQAAGPEPGQTAGAGQDRISYFSLTAGGTLLALKLRDRFGGEAHLPSCYSLGCRRCRPFDSIAEALPQSFQAGETIICVMAAGIVTRLLAPHLKSKHDDPAVLVLDEEGRHVIPLLGGHAAGANAMAREIADFLGADAAITTASDVQGMTAPDELARALGAAIDDLLALRKVTALLVDGEPVCIQSACNPEVSGYSWLAPDADAREFSGRLLISYRLPGKDTEVDPGAADPGAAAAGAGPRQVTARLIPRIVTAGVGCRRGAGADSILAAIDAACLAHGIDRRAVGALASVAAKRDEAGLSEAAARLGAELIFYSAARLRELDRPGSSFVEAAVGTPAVCEPAALLGAGPEARLLAAKTAADGVTVALAAAAPKPPALANTGAGSGGVAVVGIGAGTGPLLTAEARRAIRDADIVLGYRTYIEQVRHLFPHKEYIPGSMGAEIDRCRQARELAEAGRRVALVSSGDPGIYGMAGLMLELAGGVRVSVVPGVTAAQLAAARLGAPLMNDFVTISLSDLLTPREEVLRRVEAAAASDLVICIYNPTSKKRRPLFEAACAALLRHRSGSTPAGWVRDAGGPEETVRMCALGELAEQEVDMRTVIIIGNSQTVLAEGRMITRRGYENKTAAPERRR